jgi:hypothetical protein
MAARQVVAMTDEPLIRAVRLRREDVPDFDGYPFSMPAE